MSTLYTSDSTAWPVLQSSTEVKHGSGLLSASAQFICPANNIVMPTSIPSSEGNITNIYPPPSVSINNGLATINATGYKKWGDQNAAEIIKNTSLNSITAIANVMYFGSSFNLQKTLPVQSESATVRKVLAVSDSIPTAASLNLTLNVGKNAYRVEEFFPQIQPDKYQGNFANVAVTKYDIRIQSFRSTNFGSITEAEMVFVQDYFIYFGYYTTETPPVTPE
jgi:hypothetical protein